MTFWSSTTSYVGMTKGGVVANFVYFKPRQKWLLVEGKTGHPNGWNAALEDAGLRSFIHGSWSGFRVTERDFEEHRELLLNFFIDTHHEAGLSVLAQAIYQEHSGESP